MYEINVSIPQQLLKLFKNGKKIAEYLVTTGALGVGEQWGSFQTPRGKHVIRAKIGAGAPENTIFVARRPTGDIFRPEMKLQEPDRDWMLTRILWLSGLEPGKNRLGNVDTMRRKVYIHGGPDDKPYGIPSSRGCICMQNQDIIALFNQVPVGTRVNIDAEF